MRKLAALFAAVFCFAAVFSSCSRNLTERDEVIALFYKNEKAFSEAAASGDYSVVEEINGVQNVFIYDDHTNITCGGKGFGPSTHYYGIFHSAEDDLCAVDVAGPADELCEYGDGFLYQEKTGDNSYYVEPLGNHFFYYEAHF